MHKKSTKNNTLKMYVKVVLLKHILNLITSLSGLFYEGIRAYGHLLGVRVIVAREEIMM